MPKYSNSESADYSGLIAQTQQTLANMEAHLSMLVKENRMEYARKEHFEHKILQPFSGDGIPAYFNVPLGYAWVCERVAINVAGVTSGTVYIYRGVIAPRALAEVCVLDGNGNYADSFSNTLYVPERSELIATYVGAGNPTTMYINLQVRQIDRHINQVSSEYAYAMAGERTDYEEAEGPGRSVRTEGHSPRQGDPALEEASLGGDIAPPEPEMMVNRPQPHFAERVEQTVESVIQYIEDI